MLVEHNGSGTTAVVRRRFQPKSGMELLTQRATRSKPAGAMIILVMPTQYCQV
jgi:hypothetical protein